MRITRYIRERSRILVLVVMALLLVVFLVGDVIGSIGRGGADDPRIATAFGRPIRASDIEQADTDLGIAGSLGIGPPPVLAESDYETRIGRFLLLAEADELGLRVPRSEVLAMLEQANVPGEYIENVRNRTGRSLNSIYDAIGRVLAARTLYLYQYEAAISESRPRLEQLYRDQNQSANVDLAVIDSKALLAQVPEPTEEQLVEHFEKYKSQAASHTTDELSFGYLRPDRLAIEHATVDPAEIQTKVRVSRREAEAFYEANRARYMRELEGPASDDAGGESPKVQMTFEEAADQVREDARAEKAISEAQRAINEMLSAARREFKPDAPPAENAALLERVAERFRDAFPITIRRTELLDPAALRLEPGLGRAQVAVGRQSIPVPAYAARVEGLAGAAEAGESALKLYEPAPEPGMETRSDASGAPRAYQAYLFRVVQIAPSGPPGSLDEVRDQVRADWRLAKAHELAGAHAASLAEAARSSGLRAAVEAAAELKALLAAPPTDTQPVTDAAAALEMLGPTSPPNFRRQAGVVKNVGMAPELHARVFALVDEPGDGRRVLSMPIAKNFKWVVAELHQVNPIYEGDFEAKRAMLERSVQFTRQSEFMSQWGAFANIQTRTGYVSLIADEAE